MKRTQYLIAFIGLLLVHAAVLAVLFCIPRGLDGEAQTSRGHGHETRRSPSVARDVGDFLSRRKRRLVRSRGQRDVELFDP